MSKGVSVSVKRWIPAVVLAGVVLSGCGQTLAGSAAVVGETRLTDSELSQTVSALSTQLDIPESAQVSQAVLSRWMVAQLVDQLADQNGIEVTKGEVDAAIASETENAGGREAFEQGALQAGVLPEGIPDAVRTSLLIDKMVKFTVTGDDPTGQTGLITQVQQLSEDLDPQVSPRFGTWDAQQLTVGALPDDLSTPVVQEALTQLQPQQ
jgi:peptidyl-prolyl cis-trans isomerase SurA